MRLPPDFSDLLVALANEAVEYVVVGGYAVAFHARPRATKDIDIVVRGSQANLARASAALAAFGAPPSVVADVLQMMDDEVVFFGAPPLRIDFLRTISGVASDELFRDAVESDVDGIRLRFISLGHLIENKRAVGRPQDLLDVDLLLAAARG